MIAIGAVLVAAVLSQSLAARQLDLSLSLACGEKTGEIALSIHNVGPTDTAVLLGISLANGRWYVPREVVIELTRTGSPDVEDLVFQGPTNIAGRLDHWVVGLPGNATFTLPLYSDDFASTSAIHSTASPEELTVQLEGRPITADLNLDMTGMKAWRLWTGIARSNAIRIADCQR